MGVNPATNKHEDCKQLFVSVWLYCCSDDNVIYSHRNKFQESRAVCKKSFHFHLKQRQNWTTTYMHTTCTSSFKIMLYAYYLNDYIAMQTLTSQIIILVTLDSLWKDYLPWINDKNYNLPFSHRP